MRTSEQFTQKIVVDHNHFYFISGPGSVSWVFASRLELSLNKQINQLMKKVI